MQMMQRTTVAIPVKTPSPVSHVHAVDFVPRLASPRDIDPGAIGVVNQSAEQRPLLAR
jgi:hypothetical protein